MTDVMDEIKFSNTWFKDRTEPIWKKHLLPYADQVGGIDSYLEIGNAEGASMRWIMENIRPDFAVGIDPYVAPRPRDQKVFDTYRKNAHRNLEFWISQGKCQLIPDHSTTFFANVLGDDSSNWCASVMDWKTDENNRVEFDLIYIDGDHSAYQAILDMLLAYELLAVDTWELELSTVDRRGRQGTKNKAGGLMIIDDIHRKFGPNGRPLVGTSIPAFESVMHGRMHRLWQDGRQVCYTRIG